MKSNRNLVQWWGERNRIKQILREAKQAFLAWDAEHHLWRETPNDYTEKDLGYQTICNQRVRAKRVFDTTGISFLILGDEFKVSP